MYKASNYNSNETSGASFYEALDRYKKYERKLKDTVRPNEETLKKLSNAPFIQLSHQNTKSNFSVFPNGEKYNRQKDTSLSSEMLANEEESLNDSTVESNRGKTAKTNSTSHHHSSHYHRENHKNRKQLPSLTHHKNRTISAYSYKSNYKQTNLNKKHLQSKRISMKRTI